MRVGSPAEYEEEYLAGCLERCMRVHLNPPQVATRANGGTTVTINLALKVTAPPKILRRLLAYLNVRSKANSKLD